MLNRFIAFLIAIASSTASAEEPPRTILVLDGSGSMWGQIDGKAKITIAQEVIADLLQTLPAEQQLGLAVYGHRRKGDCSDIETLVEPGLGTRDAIRTAVNAIKPKGKTPMTDAVIAAAEKLRYTEEAATVILVSDGVETCNPDPCAAARVLEETGVDFTAHVVGFSISDPTAIAQMQCIAAETGGAFQTASNAAELTDALKTVSKPAPVSDPVEVRVYATDGKHGPRISDDLVWDLSGADTDVLEAEIAPSLAIGLLPGEYVVSVLRPADEATAEVKFGVGHEDKLVVLNLPEFRPPATLEAPPTAIAGSTIQVRWTGPDHKGDAISVTEPGQRGSHMVNYTYTKEGPLLELRMPPRPGRYEIRYVLSDGRKILARVPLEVLPVAASVTPPDSLPAGATVKVDWTGPDYHQDFIAVTERGGERYTNYSYTRNGAPLALELPTEPGEYDLVYIMSQDRTILSRTPISVTGVTYGVTAPDSAPAGSMVQIDWSGPDYRSDVISVAEIGAKGSKMLAYTYTREGSPLEVELPLEPGRYEIRYVLGQGREIAAATEIEVTAISAGLKTPPTATVGSTVQVFWKGPDYKGDIIAIGKVSEGDNKYSAYTYTSKGSPLDLQIPAYPGEYLIKYIASGPPRKLLASSPITVNDVTANLSAAPTATAGGTVEISWEGPGNDRDFIAIGQPGKNYKTYTYVREGSPLTVKVPKEPGQWEIRYIMHVDRRVLSTIPLLVQ